MYLTVVEGGTQTQTEKKKKWNKTNLVNKSAWEDILNHATFFDRLNLFIAAFLTAFLAMKPLENISNAKYSIYMTLRFYHSVN